jgi:hypothetical protein
VGWHRCVRVPDRVHVLLRATQDIKEREVCVYSISCKCQTNIDITLEWLTKHAKA